MVNGDTSGIDASGAVVDSNGVLDDSSAINDGNTEQENSDSAAGETSISESITRESNSESGGSGGGAMVNIQFIALLASLMFIRNRYTD